MSTLLKKSFIIHFNLMVFYMRLVLLLVVLGLRWCFCLHQPFTFPGTNSVMRALLPNHEEAGISMSQKSMSVQWGVPTYLLL